MKIKQGAWVCFMGDAVVMAPQAELIPMCDGRMGSGTRPPCLEPLRHMLWTEGISD